MFPLGSAPFPGAVIPLHIFEPRYLQMIDECVEQDLGFGIVLIARGSESGGGEDRFDIGTHVVVEEMGRLPDDRRLIMCRATHRLQVTEWLPDDPYPQAETIDLLEPEPGELDLGPAVKAMERIVVIASELGYDVGDFSVEVNPRKPINAVYKLANMAPVGPFDAQRLLEAADSAARLDLLNEMLVEQEELLRARLAGG